MTKTLELDAALIVFLPGGDNGRSQIAGLVLYSSDGLPDLLSCYPGLRGFG